MHNMATSFGKKHVGALSEDEVKDLHDKTEQLNLEIVFFERALAKEGDCRAQCDD
jgi:hypothetical protein